LPTISDTGTAAPRLYVAVVGYGLPQRRLEDGEVEKVWINERLAEGLSGLLDGRSSQRRCPDADSHYFG
jgi:hypothetical protein